MPIAPKHAKGMSLRCDATVIKYIRLGWGGYILFVSGMGGLASEEFGGGLGAADIGINAQLFAHE